MKAISFRMPLNASVPAFDRTIIVIPPAGGRAKSRGVSGK